MVEALIVFIVGVIGGAVATHRVLKNRMNIDYKERWQSAVDLLGVHGQLTQEQVDQYLGRAIGDSTYMSQERLRKMTDYDRAELAIDRAKRGLPDNDNLEGMGSYDTSRVIRARQRRASRKQRH